MTVNSASKVGELVVNNIPAKYDCSKIIKDLLTDLPDILTVKVPSKANLGFVAASQNAPDSSEAILWVELTGSGVPISLNYFIDGKWAKLLEFYRPFTGSYLDRKDTLESQGYVLADGSVIGADLSSLFEQSGSGPTDYSFWFGYFAGKQILPNP